jgi:hypothetical protein
VQTPPSPDDTASVTGWPKTWPTSSFERKVQASAFWELEFAGAELGLSVAAATTDATAAVTGAVGFVVGMAAVPQAASRLVPTKIPIYRIITGFFILYP